MLRGQNRNFLRTSDAQTIRRKGAKNHNQFFVVPRKNHRLGILIFVF
jgi:hypothetical protein